MTAPATIELKADRDRAGLNHTEYVLTYRGETLPTVEVVRTVDPVDGSVTVWIAAPKPEGKALLNNSQMDAVARKLLKSPRAVGGVKGPIRTARRYVDQN